jgi:predicted DNA-binding transcriptional regulator YafY
MPRNFARHEQFLRIFALIDILSEARQPLDDQMLIATIRERLGLSKLSSRTLRRDCEFLTSCGYPVDHKPIAGDRKFGWELSKVAASRKIPAEPITLLELVAFMVGRDLLRGFEGTVLWTGIESLRHKLQRDLSPAMLERLADAQRVFHVRQSRETPYSSRPRLLSTLSAAITDCREIEIEERPTDGRPAGRRRLQPHFLIIHPPAVQLLAFPAGDSSGGSPLLIDIERIDKVEPCDTAFVRRPIDPATALADPST